MHDLVIRGGTIVDGTGASAFTGDLAIDGDQIAQVGGKAASGRREVDASGLLVTPGWVDIHTHYDGQATWDPMLAPSSDHGVTTLLFGNCGVGFAPAKPAHRDALIELMEGVEDIPGSALHEGLAWDWETFPEYLDALERRSRVIDIAAQVPHHALRVYVMGDRAVRHEKATGNDIDRMAQLTDEALRAGAFGFTTSRTDQHKTTAGELVPGRFSEPEELLGIGRGMASAGRGAFGMISDFEDEQFEFQWLNQLGRVSGRPLWFLLTDRSYDPERWRRLMSGVHQAREAGVSMTAEVACRAVGLILGLSTSLTPFSIRKSFKDLDGLPLAQRLAKLRDPQVREKILNEPVSEQLLQVLPPLSRQIATRWDRLYILGDPPNYEPEQERSVAAMAAAAGTSPEAFAYDYLVGGDGERTFYFPTTNYVAGDYEAVREMMTDSGTLLGLSDGGAHCGVICDAGAPTYMLSHWARDRHRGPRLPLEWVVKAQTSETADFFGFSDRGRLQVGKKADVNIIDYDRLQLHAPRIVYDLPAGGKRLLQSAQGYVETIVSGTTTFKEGVHTGSLPGKLVRSRD